MFKTGEKLVWLNFGKFSNELIVARLEDGKAFEEISKALQLDPKETLKKAPVEGQVHNFLVTYSYLVGEGSADRITTFINNCLNKYLFFSCTYLVPEIFELELEILNMKLVQTIFSDGVLPKEWRRLDVPRQDQSSFFEEERGQGLLRRHQTNFDRIISKHFRNAEKRRTHSSSRFHHPSSKNCYFLANVTTCISKYLQTTSSSTLLRNYT